MHKHAWLALVSLVLLPAAASAVTVGTFKCEDKSAAAVAKWGGKRGKCLVKCNQDRVLKGESGRVCSPGVGFPDPETGECIMKVDDKYIAKVVSSCPTGTFPSCGDYAGETPQSFAESNRDAQAPAVDATTVPTFMCDSNPDAMKCEAKVIKTLSKLARAIGKCFSQCEKDSQLKSVTRDCKPDGADYDDVDLEMQTCVNTAGTKAEDKIVKSCPDGLPGCGLYPLGPAGLSDFVKDQLATGYNPPGPYCAP